MQGQYEFIGYYMKPDTTLPTSPVIENWQVIECTWFSLSAAIHYFLMLPSRFFACIAGSAMCEDWRVEFMRLQTFPNAEAYIKDLIDNGVDLQKMGNPTYLAMHAAMLKILQKGGKSQMDENGTIKLPTSKAYKYNVTDCTGLGGKLLI